MDRARGTMPGPPLAPDPPCGRGGRRTTLPDGADAPQRRLFSGLLFGRRAYFAGWPVAGLPGRNGLPGAAACAACLSLRAAGALGFLLGAVRTSARPASFHFFFLPGAGPV